MLSSIKKLLSDRDFFEILKGSGISLGLRFLGLVIGYSLTLVIANLFGAKGLGEYVLAITILKLFVLLAKAGLDTTSIRMIASFASKEQWHRIYALRKKIILVLSITSILASGLMYFLSESIATLINIKTSYIQLNAFFVLPMAFFMLHYQSLRGLKRIAEFSFFYRVSQAFFSIICIGIIYQFTTSSEVPIYAYLTSLSIVSFLAYISFRYWLNKLSSNNEDPEDSVINYLTLFKVSIPLMFAQSVQFIMAWTDKLMLGAMTTSEDVGIYHTAFRLSMFAAIVLMSVNSIAAPKFAEMFGKNDIDGLKKVVQQTTKMIFWLSMPLIFLFFMFPEYLLGFFGEEFKIGVTAFILLSCGRLISSFSGSVGNILIMTKNQNIYAKILFAGALLNIALNLLLIPENNLFSVFGIYGINGAAVASMSSLSFWNLSMVLVIKKRFGFFTFYVPFLKK